MTWEIPGVVMGLAMTAAPIPAMIQVAVALILIATVLAVMAPSQEEVLNPAEAPSQGAVRSPAEAPKPAMVRSLVMVPKPAMAPSPAEVPKPAMVRSPAVIPKPEKKRSPVVQIKRLEAIQMKVRTKPRNLQKKPKNPKKRMRTAAIAAEQAVIDLPDLMCQKVHKQSWKPYLPRFFRSQRMKRRPENQKTFMMT